MRIKQVHLLVAPQDLVRFLTENLNMGGVTNLAAATEEGLLRIRCSYRLGFVPIPVDLAVRVVTTTPDLVELHLMASGGAMVEEILLGMVRGSKLSYLQVQGGRLLLRVDQLAASLGGEGKLRSFAFRPEGIELGVADLVLPPPPGRG